MAGAQDLDETTGCSYSAALSIGGFGGLTNESRWATRSA
jgi:hypothetical protein